eukprot:TRINITY_DN67336_c11_g1_i1.p2 TRINITY_DN67336_c11_g1~~TRINITY_DN67336_c11_g1_i1.p2  ORF type:complete len:374 (+),score=47.43 TRINITY_DN67336_c11_g1_i1:28-1149(+)
MPDFEAFMNVSPEAQWNGTHYCMQRPYTKPVRKKPIHLPEPAITTQEAQKRKANAHIYDKAPFKRLKPTDPDEEFSETECSLVTARDSRCMHRRWKNKPALVHLLQRITTESVEQQEALQEDMEQFKAAVGSTCETIPMLYQSALAQDGSVITTAEQRRTTQQVKRDNKGRGLPAQRQLWKCMLGRLGIHKVESSVLDFFDILSFQTTKNVITGGALLAANETEEPAKPDRGLVITAAHMQRAYEMRVRAQPNKHYDGRNEGAWAFLPEEEAKTDKKVTVSVEIGEKDVLGDIDLHSALDPDWTHTAEHVMEVASEESMTSDEMQEDEEQEELREEVKYLALTSKMQLNGGPELLALYKAATEGQGKKGKKTA